MTWIPACAGMTLLARDALPTGVVPAEAVRWAMSKRQFQKGVNHTRRRLSVVPKSSGWTIEGFPSGAARTYRTQREAIAAARKLVEAKEGGEIVVHGRDGRIRGVDTYALGGDSFDKISAVEGIFLSEEIKRDFRGLDRKRLSPEKRREWLIAKYGSRSDDIRRRK